MKRKLISFSLLAALVLSALTACGETGTTGTGTGTGSGTGTEASPGMMTTATTTP
jgi:hypothetical protein